MNHCIFKMVEGLNFKMVTYSTVQGLEASMDSGVFKDPKYGIVGILGYGSEAKY